MQPMNMPPLKFILLILLLTTNALVVLGQPANESFNIPSFNDSLSITAIIRQTEVLPSNTQKVRQLLAIARIYRDIGRGTNLDTSLTYIQEAYTISTAIHDTAGTNEALAWQCELYMVKEQSSLAVALLPMTHGNVRIRLMLLIAEGYIGRQPVDISFLEKALPWLSKATQLADSLQSAKWRYECLMLRSKYFFEHGNIEAGRADILAIIKSCDSLGDKKGAGHYWLEMNKYMPITSGTAPYILFACRQSIRAYQEAGDQHDALYALRDLASQHRYIGQYDSAEKEFMIFLRETARSGITPSVTTNIQLGALYLEKGDPAKGLDYYLRALNGIGRSNSRKGKIYSQLAVIYQLTGVPAEELNYGRLAVEEAIRFKTADRHYFTTFVIEALIKQGYPEKALAYLQQFNASNPALSPEQQQPIAYDYGLIYDALGDYPKAAPWFRQLADLDSVAQKKRDEMVFRIEVLDPFLMHVYTGRFYVHWGKYQQARPILQLALRTPLPYKGFTDGGELQLLLYKTDSAIGDLRSAIGHYLLYTAIKDSMFNARKIRQLQTLQVQYQTKEREQSILLLRSESQRQRDQLNKESFTRKIAFGGIILLLILAAWAYYAYQAKRRNVQKLLQQQAEISEKNLALEQLVGEKNELLTEKNLLLQEVHHRVKNNLHTVMSLLESQSVYLSDPAARSALLDSQNRIQTISLLHQKLYWSSNVTSIEMAPYIAELCAFLASSLGARERRITITHSIDPIQLDISQGLPIGLLLNEAITNALKHAFPANTDQNAAQTGHIGVTLQSLPDGLISLQISDDGIGMPPGPESRTHSLGMTLMKSIGQKLAERFTIESSDKGVRVTLEFRQFTTGPSMN
jgi:two-component sensor histidine kinase